MAMQRLDKTIASTGRWSRREVKLLVKEGRVLVDGYPARSAEDKVDPAVNAIEVDGENIGYREFTYIMLHKPAGLLTATEDKRQETVMDLLTPDLRRLSHAPVGRLDKDTTGLLILTNDGDYAHRIISPKTHVSKRYMAQTDGIADAADAAAFAEGIVLRDGTVCLPAGLEVTGTDICYVTLLEGKYHQVKRMLASRGKPVVKLHRCSIGALSLDESLRAGEFRRMTAEEVENSLVKLPL